MPKPFFLLLLVCATIFSCKGKNEKNFDIVNYEKTKETLADKEKSSPLSFLKVTGTDKRKWLFGTTVYKGTIHNKATVCAYKDVRVKLLYFNTAGVLVANHEELLDDVVSPNSEIDFKAKYHTPKGTDSVSAYIMSAKVVKE